MPCASGIWFPPSFLHMINVKQTNANVQIFNNGHLSSDIELKRGLAQGCGASPYLFILAIKTLAHFIHFDPPSLGLTLQVMKKKISAGFTYLGLHLSNNLHYMTRNYWISFQVPRSIMENWAVCSMGVLGGIFQIKQLVASMFVYRFTLLPSPPASHMKVLDHTYFDNVWNHKCHRLNPALISIMS